MNPSNFKKLLEEALDPIKKTQKGHSETLESLNSSVVTMETTINVYQQAKRTTAFAVGELDLIHSLL